MSLSTLKSENVAILSEQIKNSTTVKELHDIQASLMNDTCLYVDTMQKLYLSGLIFNKMQTL